MENEVQKFDAEDAMKQIKDKIKSAFVEMIPDEQWNAMVKTEIDNYFKVDYRDGYRNSIRFSTFQQDVHSELEILVKEKVKEHLTTYFAPAYNSKGYIVANENVEKFIKENVGNLMTTMIGTMIQQTMLNAGYNM